MASNCASFCGLHKLTRSRKVPEGILLENHFLRSAVTKSFLNNLRKCLGEHRIWSSHWTLWKILFDINKRRWGLFRMGRGSNDEQSQVKADAREVIWVLGHFSRALLSSLVSRNDNIKLRFHLEQKTGWCNVSVWRSRVDTKHLECCNQSVTFWLNTAFFASNTIASRQRNTKSCHFSFLQTRPGS